LNDSDSTRTLTLTWTIKEALSKVLRTGLMTPFEIFCLQSIQFENNKWVSQFKNFAQYQAISFQLGKFICSIVCPKRSQIQIDIIKLQQWFANKDNT
jgi:4'-phosphopantetheinyl transferase